MLLDISLLILVSGGGGGGGEGVALVSLHLVSLHTLFVYTTHHHQWRSGRLTGVSGGEHAHWIKRVRGCGVDHSVYRLYNNSTHTYTHNSLLLGLT